MYRLVTGFVAHLMQKQEVRSLCPACCDDALTLCRGCVGLRHAQYSVLIMGLDNAGKTTFLGEPHRSYGRTR